MKKNNFKIKTTIASLILMGFSGVSFAQQAVIDGALIGVAKSGFASLGSLTGTTNTILTNILLTNKAGFTGVGGQIQQLNATTTTLIQQEAMNLKNADMRNRAIGAQQDILNKTAGTLRPAPTLAECVAITQAKKNQVAVKSSNRGGGGGRFNPLAKASAPPTSDDQIPADIISSKESLGTCTKADIGAGKCTAEQPYAGGDYLPRGLDCNAKGIPLESADKAICNNYTLNDEAQKVANQNISNQTLYGQPKALTPDQMKKNPSYDAVTTPINAKLFAASEALHLNARFRQESTSAPEGTAKDMWNGGAEYTKVTGLEAAPEKPSLYDLTNYAVMNSFVGNPKSTQDMAELNKRLALTNFILWKSYQQQENTNRLLANILTQMVTPVSKTQADTIFNQNKALSK